MRAVPQRSAVLGLLDVAERAGPGDRSPAERPGDTTAGARISRRDQRTSRKTLVPPVQASSANTTRRRPEGPRRTRCSSPRRATCASHSEQSRLGFGIGERETGVRKRRKLTMTTVPAERPRHALGVTRGSAPGKSGELCARGRKIGTAIAPTTSDDAEVDETDMRPRPRLRSYPERDGRDRAEGRAGTRVALAADRRGFAGCTGARIGRADVVHAVTTAAIRRAELAARNASYPDRQPPDRGSRTSLSRRLA
jgi:hypothetical protein